jgi:hypothetical protein
LLPLTSQQHERLGDVLALLIHQQHYWAADIAIRVYCHPIGTKDSVPQETLDEW